MKLDRARLHAIKRETNDDIPAMRRKLKGHNWNVRLAAVEAFGKLGTRDDLERLLNEQEDLPPDVVAYLDRALYLPDCLRPLFKKEGEGED